MRFCLILFSLLSVTAIAKASDLVSLDKSSLLARQQVDLRSVQIYRDGLQHTDSYIQTRPDLFPAQHIEKRILPDASKTEVRSLWKSVLDYQMALEALETYHKDFYLLRATTAREQSLLLTYAAHLARYRFVLDFIERTENDPELSKVLNEPISDLGLEKGSYDRFKFHFLNIGLATQFSALSALYKASTHPAPAMVAEKMNVDSSRIWEMGRGKGSAMTVANAFAILRGTAQSAVFPAQAGISEWMGDNKVLRQNLALITETQIAAMLPKLQPGDVMLQRREWYFSNVGLPGFWSHAALYIGSAPERRAYFDDVEVRAWVKQQGITDGDFEKLLAQRYPQAYATSLTLQEHEHVPRVLEAISEGVSFTTLEHSAAADSLVTLRPRLSKREQAFAILRAFGYAGRPYDFDFDFQTDASLVCTELVYKAYEPTPDFKGLRMQPQEIVGRLAIPANDIARDFDRDYQTPQQQWDMVIFLDGEERKKRAVGASVESFRTSWQRPKWHILLPTKQTKAGAAP